MSRDIARVMSDVQRAARIEDIPGCWPGRVESVDDPKRMDRIRVRVFVFHGTKQDTPTEALPWAETSSLNGGGYDYGSSGQQYPVGSNVWVMFAMGKLDHPVVFGGCRSHKRVKDDLNDGQVLTIDGVSPTGSDETWIPAEDSELPKDIHEDSCDADTHPTVTVWQKSFKGHTIRVEDTDEFESLHIIDRAGQVLEMNCPVTAEKNKNNSEQRGARSSIRDNQVSQDSLVNGRAFIRLKDVAGQEVILDGKANDEQIRLVSRNRLGTSEQVITLSSGKGKEFIEISDKQGNHLRFDPNGSIPILIEDHTGNKIEFDSQTGQVKTISTASSSDLVASDKEIQVGGAKSEIIGGDDNLKVVGKKLVNVIGDFAASIGGLTSVALTGPVQVQIANAQLPAGTPAPTGLSLELVLGNFSISSKVGSGLIKAPLGIDVQGTGAIASESAALGDSTSSALDELAAILQDSAANFGIGNLGGPVPINPAVIAKLVAWRLKYIATPATNVVSQLHKVSRI